MVKKYKFGTSKDALSEDSLIRAFDFCSCANISEYHQFWLFNRPTEIRFGNDVNTGHDHLIKVQEIAETLKIAFVNAWLRIPPRCLGATQTNRGQLCQPHVHLSVSQINSDW